MSHIHLTSLPLGHNGISSAWAAMRKVGYSERELASNPELFAYMAMHSGVQNYRKIKVGERVLVPDRDSLEDVVEHVRANKAFYLDAMTKAPGGLAKWRREFVPRRRSTASVEIPEPRGSTMASARSSGSQAETPPQAPPGSHATVTSTTGGATAARESAAAAPTPVSAAEATPQALQVADRFRLIQRLNSITGFVQLPAQTTRLSWTPPTQNEDGTPLTDLAGYKIYYGTTSGTYTTEIDVGNVTEFTIENLPEGTYYFAATAYNVAGTESRKSGEATKTVVAP